MKYISELLECGIAHPSRTQHNGKWIKCAMIPLKCGFFEITGLPWVMENKYYSRFPDGLTPEETGLPTDMINNARCPSGATVRFRTNSASIGIYVKYLMVNGMTHVPHASTSGFDFYIGEGKNKSFAFNLSPDMGDIQLYAIRGEGGVSDEVEWTVYMPTWTVIEDIKLLLSPDAYIKPPLPRKIEDPVLYTGASGTMGAAASRPGLTHCGFIERHFDCGTLNMGYSSHFDTPDYLSGLLSELKLSAVIFECDNFPEFYRIMRQRQPKLPIITRDANIDKCEEAKDDQYVIAVSPVQYDPLESGHISCDSLHPSSLGFLRMAQNYYDALERAFTMK